MADRMLFIGWGYAVRGAETRALDAFNEAVGLLGRMQQDGRIEDFDVCLLAPNSELGGYFTVRGSAAQISALRIDEAFQRATINAQLSVDGIRHLEGYTNEGVAGQMAMFQEALAAAAAHATV